jgi:hypothetical protein
VPRATLGCCIDVTKETPFPTQCVNTGTSGAEAGVDEAPDVVNEEMCIQQENAAAQGYKVDSSGTRASASARGGAIGTSVCPDTTCALLAGTKDSGSGSGSGGGKKDGSGTTPLANQSVSKVLVARCNGRTGACECLPGRNGASCEFAAGIDDAEFVLPQAASEPDSMGLSPGEHFALRWRTRGEMDIVQVLLRR